VLAGPKAGKLSDRIGRKRLIIGSSVALALLMLATTPLIRGFWAAAVLFSSSWR
jgi:MFS family permease